MPRPFRLPIALCLTAASTFAACSSSTSTAPTTTAPKTTTTHAPRPGSVNLAFAGSTQVMNEQFVGPSFTRATGYAYTGQGAGSAALAQYIAAGTYSSNVFESVGGSPIVTLEPRFTSWYVQFAANPLVITYNPSGPFSSTLSAVAKGKAPIADLFGAMSSPGFHLGRTDPNVDPQGQGFLLMLQLAQSQLSVPAGTVQSVLANSQIFSETALQSTLQAGQLDAAGAYLPQAVQMHLPYISLPDSINLGNPADASAYASASITLSTPPGKVVKGIPLSLCITAVNQPGQSASDLAAAQAFVAFTLSPAGQALFRDEGYTLLSPTLYGDATGVPPSIIAAVRAIKPTPSSAPSSGTAATSAPSSGTAASSTTG